VWPAWEEVNTNIAKIELIRISQCGILKGTLN
jgi:hypothetical protein